MSTSEIFGRDRSFLAEVRGACGAGSKVIVGGKEITSAVRRVTIDASVGSLPRVEVELGAYEATRLEAERAEVHLSPATRDLLLAAGWGPPETANRCELEETDPLGSHQVTIVEHEGHQLRVIPMALHDQHCQVRVASSQGTTPDVLHCHFCGYCYPPPSDTSPQAETDRVVAIDLSAEQAQPVPNGSPSVQGMVRADLETREQLGVQRCGTALQPHNGRDALRDLYEELLDAACYTRQAIEERPREDVDLRARLRNAHAAAEELASLLTEVLGHFTQKGHPGRACVRTGWISEATVDGWRATVYGPPLAAALAAEQEDGANRG